MRRSIPLWLRCLVVFVGLVVTTTLALTVTAYQSARDMLEANARASVRHAAETADQAITNIVSARMQSLQGVIAGARALCGEELDGGRMAWAIECVSPLIVEFHAAQRALGAEAAYKNRVLVRAGLPLLATNEEAGTIAQLSRGPSGDVRYQVRASDAGLSLAAEFSFSEMAAALFSTDGVGNAGNVLVADRGGRLLTTSDRPDARVEAQLISLCLTQSGEATGPDYGGALVYHAFRPISALGACVDAHMPVSEALAPALLLRSTLMEWGVVFILVGGLLSVLAAHWIAAPVRDLAAAAMGLRRGDFDQPVPVTGPSEVRELARAFREMSDELARRVRSEQSARRYAETANAAKNQFLALVSHELRTPLNAVVGWASHARMHRLEGDDLKRALSAIEHGAEAQRRLIDDLIDVARIEKGQMRLGLRMVALADPVRRAIDSLQPQADDKRIRLDIALDAAAVVEGDPDRLQQIAANLLSNAVKFTPEGGNVSVQVRRASTRVELVVSDTGPGIAPELLPHVFEWFRQGDTGGTRRISGLGLGLGIVRHLVELHGGHVDVESTAGHGATFVVQLSAVDSIEVFDGPLAPAGSHRAPGGL